MGLLCEYFAARSDAVAAETVDWTGGPSRPPRHDGADAVPEALPTVPMPGAEPVVTLRSLESILTGRSLDEIPREPVTPVALRDGGARLVLPVSPRVVAALVAADDARLAQAALTWAGTPELARRADPAQLGDGLCALAALARGATSRGERVYCWMAV